MQSRVAPLINGTIEPCRQTGRNAVFWWLQSVRLAVVLWLFTCAAALGDDALSERGLLQWHNQLQRAIEAGDANRMVDLSTNMYQLSASVRGDNHPDTKFFRHNLMEVRVIAAMPDEQRRLFGATTQRLNRATEELNTNSSSVFPNVSRVIESLSEVRETREIFAKMGASGDRGVIVADFFLLQVDTMGRRWRSASQNAGQFLKTWAPSKDRYELECLFAQLMRANVLMELGEETGWQIQNVKSYGISFEPYASDNRFRFGKERALTLLAEIYFRNNNRDEADRLYAQVCGLLPDKPNDILAGWCKSWCDRHEARQLMEKGDWDGAYNKILLARAGTIDYGHRNLNKGLTMERILRLSAEIQRKRGHDKEAKEDLEYADLIANRAARLREALEEEMKSQKNERAGGDGRSE